MPSLTVELRDSYQQVAAVLPEDADLLTRPRDISIAGSGPGERLMAIVLAYRAGPRRLWAPVLLDLLAPALLARLKRLRAEPPVVDEADVRQQLVLELLCAAATMPLPARAGYLKSRLMARANQGVRRWLQKERRRQRGQAPFDEIEEGKR